MTRLEIGAGAALVGAGIFSVHDLYTKHAGDLSDVRQASSADPATRQQLLDADALTAGVTLLAGGALSIATGKWYPLALSAVAFGLVSFYYHAALRAPVTESAY